MMWITLWLPISQGQSIHNQTLSDTRHLGWAGASLKACSTWYGVLRVSDKFGKQFLWAVRPALQKSSLGTEKTLSLCFIQIHRGQNLLWSLGPAEIVGLGLPRPINPDSWHIALVSFCCVASQPPLRLPKYNLNLAPRQREAREKRADLVRLLGGRFMSTGTWLWRFSWVAAKLADSVPALGSVTRIVQITSTSYFQFKVISLQQFPELGEANSPQGWGMVLLLLLCPTLWDPVECNPPGSSVHWIFQTKILEWAAISFSRGSSRARDQSLHLLRWRADSLPLTHQRSPEERVSSSNCLGLAHKSTGGHGFLMTSFHLLL